MERGLNFIINYLISSYFWALKSEFFLFYSNDHSHIYILLSSLNVIQISAGITNIFTYITLVAICPM